ncbi:MAG: carboxypeptidase-like regulatory domain-containing protein, partial [Bacteroidia bacterium]|nr:carboxypeptidase-like regulatory domain-containing protein [Bacteroidia bacterium]
MRIFKGIILPLLLSSSVELIAQTGTIRGSITDPNGEPVIGATVILQGTSQGTNTNLQGIFSIPKVSPGKYNLRITYVGFDTLYQPVELSGDKTITLKLKLKETSTTLETIEITEKLIAPIEQNKVNIAVTKVSAKEI